MPLRVPPPRRQLFVLVAIVALVTAFAGIVWSIGDESRQDEPDFGRASVQVATLDGLNATVRTTIDRGTETYQSVERVSLRPDRGAVRSVDVSEQSGRGELSVSNGSVLWLFDRERNAVTKIELTDVDDRTPSRIDQLQVLFEQLNRTGEATDAGSPRTTPGIEPLPAVPHAGAEPTGTAAPATADGAGMYEVTVNGTATVAGRETYVVDVTKTETNGTAFVEEYSQTLWVDSKWFYPLQQRTTWVADGDRTTITTTYENVTFNPGLTDETFRFDPPADATVSEPDVPDTDTYDSVNALHSDAEMTVPEPELPPSFELAYASRTEGRVRGVGLQYVNATAGLSVSKDNLSWYEPSTEAESVSIGDQEGEYRDLGPTTSLSWACGEYRYTIRGRGVSKTRMLEVARSIECS